MAWHTINSEPSTCSQGQEAESLPTFCLDTYLLELAKSRNTRAKCCCKGSEMESCQCSLSGTTSEHSTGDRGEDLSMLSQVASHAKTLAAPEKEQESKESDQDCGEKWQGSFAKYGHDTHSWRTHQCSLFGGWEPYSEAWPRWGMMRDGACWERTALAHHTSGIESGSEQNWPTPNKSDSKGANLTNGHDIGRSYLRAEVILRGKTWPTPRKFMHKDSETDRGKSNLGEVVGGKLNPDWVEWLMGWPIGHTSPEPITLDWRTWQQDPADTGKIPRIGTGIPNRAARLKAIGNGQVPQCAALAWTTLAER